MVPSPLPVEAAETLPGRPPLLCIVGPTASGKSALALTLAERWGAEIISLDASQVYQGMDIGTAKVSVEEQARVKHHLLDCVAPDESFTAADFCARAGPLIERLYEGGQRVILCGGTGFYLNALLYGLWDAPPADPTISAELGARRAREGAAALHRELAELDPESAARLHPNDGYRIERALGFFLTHQRSISAARASHQRRSRYPHLILGLDPPREVLNARIEQRVHEMIRAGLFEEVEGLQRSGYQASLKSMGAIGYRLALSHLEGAISQADFVEQTAAATRQYARRQRRYFNRQLSTHWLAPPVDDALLKESLISLWGLDGAP